MAATLEKVRPRFVEEPGTVAYVEEYGKQEEKVTSAILEGLELKIVGTDSAAMVVQSDFSFIDDNGKYQGYFDGNYSYAGTSFDGRIAFDVEVGNVLRNNIVAGTVGVSGQVEATGFQPFSIETIATGNQKSGAEMSMLFTRGSDIASQYQLALKGKYTKAQSLSASDTTIIRMGDSNGVKAQVAQIAGSSVSSFKITDLNGVSLGTLDEKVNGWEIIYADGGSESLY